MNAARLAINQRRRHCYATQRAVLRRRRFTRRRRLAYHFANIFLSHFSPISLPSLSLPHSHFSFELTLCATACTLPIKANGADNGEMAACVCAKPIVSHFRGSKMREMR